MAAHEVIAELDALADDLARAMEEILTASEKALDRAGDSSLALVLNLNDIMAACAVGDLAAQRIAKLKAMLSGEAAGGDSLLNGPALTRMGLDQTAADALLKRG